MLSNNTTRADRSFSDGTATGDIIWLTVYFTQAFAVFITNLLTIITFTINRHLRKRSVYCLINLAVADMLVGLVVFGTNVLMWKMYGIEFFDKNYFRRKTTLWIDVAHIVLASATMLSLALVAVERMCAIQWPIYTSSQCETLCVQTCHLNYLDHHSSGWIAISHCNKHNHACKRNKDTQLSWSRPAIFLVVAVICVSYIMIFIKVKSQQQHVAGQRLPRRERGLVMTLFIVTVASIVAWIPLAMVHFLQFSSIVAYFPNQLYLACFSLALSNSLINPIIYVFRMKDFRKAFLKLILTCSRHRPTLVVPHQNLQARHFTGT
jgi:hypothetical protein